MPGYDLTAAGVQGCLELKFCSAETGVSPKQHLLLQPRLHTVAGGACPVQRPGSGTHGDPE